MAATTLLTSEQYLAMPEQFDHSGNRVKDELIGGEIVKVPPASGVHHLIKNRINRLLILYLHNRPDLKLESLVEIGTGISSLEHFVPDVSVIGRDRLGGEGRIFQASPDLAIEIVSPFDTAKHLKRKVDAYLQGGSKSVWVVYPDAKSVEIYSGDPMREYKADQNIEDPLLPGFSAPVASFFDLT
jgi:Uma2 family endonuclease